MAEAAAGWVGAFHMSTDPTATYLAEMVMGLASSSTIVAFGNRLTMTPGKEVVAIESQMNGEVPSDPPKRPNVFPTPAWMVLSVPVGSVSPPQHGR